MTTEPSDPIIVPEIPDDMGDRLGSFFNSLPAMASDFFERLISVESLQQLAIIAAAIAIGFLLSRYPARLLRRQADARDGEDILSLAYRALARVSWAVAAVIILWIATATFSAFDQPNYGLRIAASLLNAFTIVRLISSLMNPGFWSRFFAVFAWTIAALYIVRALDPITEALDSAAFQIADMRVSLLRIVTTFIVLAIAFWIGRFTGDAAQAQLRGSKSLTPSMAGLLGQLAKAFFMILAVVIALSAVGVNLTALTVLSGAIGVGIGFGLQAIFSNFASGIILLFEKSVKVGDFIELEGDVRGRVSEISIRSTRITTNDNVDIVVPNEDFIKKQVINWTLHEGRRRLRLPFGVAYGTDKELVRKAGIEAASELDWVYDAGGTRPPEVWLVNYGDSSLDFELVVWLTEEATKIPGRVEANFYWVLHTALEKYDIEIPFPQRDLHLRSPDRILLGGREDDVA